MAFDERMNALARLAAIDNREDDASASEAERLAAIVVGHKPTTEDWDRIAASVEFWFGGVSDPVAVEMMRRAVYTLAGGLYVHRRLDGMDVYDVGRYYAYIHNVEEGGPRELLPHVYGAAHGSGRFFGATLTPATWDRGVEQVYGGWTFGIESVGFYAMEFPAVYATVPGWPPEYHGMTLTPATWMRGAS